MNRLIVDNDRWMKIFSYRPGFIEICAFIMTSIHVWDIIVEIDYTFCKWRQILILPANDGYIYYLIDKIDVREIKWVYTAYFSSVGLRPWCDN